LQKKKKKQQPKFWIRSHACQEMAIEDLIGSIRKDSMLRIEELRDYLMRTFQLFFHDGSMESQSFDEMEDYFAVCHERESNGGRLC
jgi:hypothetical protein